jgi:hypothetical protein
MHPGIQSWKSLVIYAYSAFSIPLLLKTLFSPWKNDRDAGPNAGILEKVVFFIFSRILGFIARAVLIIIGLFFTFLVILTFPIFFLLPIKINVETLQNMGSFGASLSYGETETEFKWFTEEELDDISYGIKIHVRHYAKTALQLALKN